MGFTQERDYWSLLANQSFFLTAPAMSRWMNMHKEKLQCCIWTAVLMEKPAIQQTGQLQREAKGRYSIPWNAVCKWIMELQNSTCLSGMVIQGPLCRSSPRTLGGSNRPWGLVCSVEKGTEWGEVDVLHFLLVLVFIEFRVYCLKCFNAESTFLWLWKRLKSSTDVNLILCHNSIKLLDGSGLNVMSPTDHLFLYNTQPTHTWTGKEDVRRVSDTKETI